MKEDIKKARFLAKLLDSQFKIGEISFGIDPIVSMIPFFGSFIGIFLSLYIFDIGRRMNISRFDQFMMIWNIVLDFLVGLIPFLGVIFDIGLKANLRNLKILEKFEDKMKIEEVVEGKIVS